MTIKYDCVVKCEVERLSYGPWIVTFPDYPNKEIFLQSDWDQASFANSCGLIPTDSPSSQEFIDCDPEDIIFCSDEYLNVAENTK